MKVSGFTFVKDAVKYYFPVVESIQSMLSLCDEIIVNVGLPDTDGTLKLIKSIKNKKIKIITTKWDPLFKAKGRILAQQTNIALYQCTGDWCLYLQADEVLHEKDHWKIYRNMKEYQKDDRVQGLLFDYMHFFGSYKTYVRSYHWYKKEIRIIKNHIGVTSWRSAQSFRLDGKKLSVRDSNSRIFHYGWVRPPEVMIAKKQYHDSLHHGNTVYSTRKDKYKVFFEFVDQIDPFMIKEYKGDHPAVMKDRIKNWKYEFDKKKSNHKLSFRDMRYRMTDVLANLTGIKLGEYRNYIKL
ncbi:MAG: glycosyltransferase family 2 protein [Spirochaetes bacterium]|nr:glycosyltransferase family 2 protein [Spirochaetota bacterium]